MGKFRKKRTPSAEGIQNARAQEELAAERETVRVLEEEKKAKRDRRIAVIVLFTVAAVMFAVSAAFAGITVARMRRYELDFVRTEGRVTDFEVHGMGGKAYFTLVISYSYGGREYSFADSMAFEGLLSEALGSGTEILVNPDNPAEAVRVNSSGSFSVIAAVVFAISAFTFAIGVSLTGGGYKRRALLGYLPVFLAGIVFMFLFWFGLPYDDFGAVFGRMGGASGYLSLSVLAAVAAAIDGAVTLRFRKKRI